MMTDEEFARSRGLPPWWFYQCPACRAFLGECGETARATTHEGKCCAWCDHPRRIPGMTPGPGTICVYCGESSLRCRGLLPGPHGREGATGPCCPRCKHDGLPDVMPVSECPRCEAWGSIRWTPAPIVEGYVPGSYLGRLFGMWGPVIAYRASTAEEPTIRPVDIDAVRRLAPEEIGVTVFRCPSCCGLGWFGAPIPDEWYNRILMPAEPGEAGFAFDFLRVLAKGDRKRRREERRRPRRPEVPA